MSDGVGTGHDDKSRSSTPGSGSMTPKVGENGELCDKALAEKLEKTKAKKQSLALEDQMTISSNTALGVTGGSFKFDMEKVFTERKMQEENDAMRKKLIKENSTSVDAAPKAPAANEKGKPTASKSPTALMTSTDKTPPPQNYSLSPTVPKPPKLAAVDLNVSSSSKNIPKESEKAIAEPSDSSKKASVASNEGASQGSFPVIKEEDVGEGPQHPPASPIFASTPSSVRSPTLILPDGDPDDELPHHEIIMLKGLMPGVGDRSDVLGDRIDEKYRRLSVDKMLASSIDEGSDNEDNDSDEEKDTVIQNKVESKSEKAEKTDSPTANERRPSFDHQDSLGAQAPVVTGSPPPKKSAGKMKGDRSFVVTPVGKNPIYAKQTSLSVTSANVIETGKAKAKRDADQIVNEQEAERVSKAANGRALDSPALPPIPNGTAHGRQTSPTPPPPPDTLTAQQSATTSCFTHASTNACKCAHLRKDTRTKTKICSIV